VLRDTWITLVSPSMAASRFTWHVSRSSHKDAT
jgi:hypothetical protein